MSPPLGDHSIIMTLVIIWSYSLLIYCLSLLECQLPGGRNFVSFTGGPPLPGTVRGFGQKHSASSFEWLCLAQTTCKAHPTRCWGLSGSSTALIEYVAFYTFCAQRRILKAFPISIQAEFKGFWGTRAKGVRKYLFWNSTFLPPRTCGVHPLERCYQFYQLLLKIHFTANSFIHSSRNGYHGPGIIVVAGRQSFW